MESKDATRLYNLLRRKLIELSMNSNQEQDFKDIRSLSMKLQRICRDEDLVVNLILQKIDALDQLYLENDAGDLIEIKEKLKTFRSSQQRTIYHHTVKHLREILENYLSSLAKGELTLFHEKSAKTPPLSFGSKRRKRSRDLFLERLGGRNNINPSDNQGKTQLQKAENSLEEPSKDVFNQESDLKAWTERGNYNIANEEDKAEEKGPRAASKETGFPLKNIKRWMITGPSRKKGGGRKTLDPVMEEKLYQWIVDQQRICGELLTRCEIKKKAKEISSVGTFKASKGWLDKFKKRFGINVRPNASESESIQSEPFMYRPLNLNLRKTSKAKNDQRREPSVEDLIQLDKGAPLKQDTDEILIESNKTRKSKQISRVTDIHDFLNLSEDQN